MEERESAQLHPPGNPMPRPSLDLLSGLLESLPGAHYAKSIDGEYLTASAGFCELVGQPMDHLIGKRDKDLHLDENPLVQPRLDDQVMAEDTSRAISVVGDASEGGGRLWTVRKSPLHDSHGHVVGVLSSAVEGSGDPATRAAHVGSCDRCQAMFDNSPVGLAEVDLSALKARIGSLKAAGVADIGGILRKDGEEVDRLAGIMGILAMNRTLMQLLKAEGMDAPLEAGRRLLTVANRDVFVEELLALMAGEGGHETEALFDLGDGASRIMRRRCSVVPGREGDWARVLFSHEDVTQERTMEAAIHDSEKRYRVLFEEYHAAVVLAEAETGLIVDANRRAEALFGQPRSEMRGMHLSRLHPPEESDKYMRILRSRSQPDDSGMFIGEIVKSTGERVTTIISCIHFEAGGKRYLHGIYTDLTASREAERRILEQRNRAEFYLDLMAHDVSNLNQGIITAMELVKMNGQVPMGLAKYVDLTLRLSGRITTIVSSVCRLSRLIDAEMVIERYDAMELLSVAARRVHRAHPHKDIHIDLPEESSPVAVIANEMLVDVFTNILDNAVKFDRHAHIDVGVEVVPVDGGKTWRFEFRDHGPGVPDSMKETVFHRLDHTGDGERGTGLGLTLVDVVVHRLGGSAWVEDRVKGVLCKGSCFVVELPAAH